MSFSTFEQKLIIVEFAYSKYLCLPIFVEFQMVIPLCLEEITTLNVK